MTNFDFGAKKRWGNCVNKKGMDFLIGEDNEEKVKFDLMEIIYSMNLKAEIRAEQTVVRRRGRTNTKLSIMNL